MLVSNIDHSNWLIAGERELAQNIADDLPRRMQRHRPVPVRDHRDHGMPTHNDLHGRREHDIPMLKGELPGLRALASRLNHRRRVPPARDVQPAEPLAGAGALAELDSAEVAAAYDVPYVRRERCDTADAAVAAAEQIGYPVVAEDRQRRHTRQASAAFALNLLDASQVRDAAARMGGAVIVAEQVAGGVEVLVGMVRDQDYGPTVVVARRSARRGARPGHRQPRPARPGRRPRVGGRPACADQAARW